MRRGQILPQQILRYLDGIQSRPVRVLPAASTGAVVSSAWMRSAAKTWAWDLPPHQPGRR